MAKGQKYTFWIYGSGKKPSLDYTRLFECTVTKDEIEIKFSSPKVILIDNVLTCKILPKVSYTGRIVEIYLRNGKKFYIPPSSVYFPTSPLNNASETFAFVELVNAFINGERIDLDPNPYEREKRYYKKLPFSGEGLDLNVSPLYYYKTLRKRLPFWKNLLQFLVGLVISISILMIIVFLLGGFD